MNQFLECPNCEKYQVGVPLRTEGDSMVCPVCESTFEKEQWKNIKEI